VEILLASGLRSPETIADNELSLSLEEAKDAYLRAVLEEAGSISEAARRLVEPARLTLHRVQRQDIDATFAIAEVFSPDSLRKDEKARLCLSDVGRRTDGPMGAPYLNSRTALTLPVCDLANVDAPGKLHDIELRSGKEVVLKARLGQPPPMSLKTKLTREREGFRVSASGALPIHRVVVWSARYEQNQPAILWTSEARPDLMTRREREFEYLMPSEVVIDCASCVIGVQAVSQVASGPISVSSEGSAVLPPRSFYDKSAAHLRGSRSRGGCRTVLRYHF
jgi:hypothetical protein